MSNSLLPSEYGLQVTPSLTSSKSDFDFLVGCFNVRHKKLKSRLNNCEEWIEFQGSHQMHKILGGIGNIETHSMTDADGNPIEGIALRLFNHVTKLWSVHWANSQDGKLGAAVVGSFDKNIGKFFSKDTFNGKEVLVQFLWDSTNSSNPTWAQAFSIDNGKTWEWNWYMFFTKIDSKIKSTDTTTNLPSQNIPTNNIKLIELRNYVLKPGWRDRFISYFENNLVRSQNEMGAHILGTYRVMDAPDNFLWIRGFSDMESRSKFLPSFYYSTF